MATGNSVMRIRVGSLSAFVLFVRRWLNESCLLCSILILAGITRKLVYPARAVIIMNLLPSGTLQARR